MKTQVWSEVGRLREVLVHRPGAEVVHMTQDELGSLLFDDILSRPIAAAEHGVLQEILRAGGASVVEVGDLLTQALSAAPDGAVAELVGRVCDVAGVPEIAPFLEAWEPSRLAEGLIAGVSWSQLADAPLTLARLRRQLEGEPTMPLSPLPNLMFMRDACFATYDQVVVGRMATSARAREPHLVSFALRHSGILGDTPELLFDQPDAGRSPVFRSIEGGDVLVLSDRFMMIGCSERTTPQTIERIAREALFDTFPHLEAVYAVMMPAKRSVMHLDTILTQVDRTLFLGHEPLVGEGGCPVVRLRRGRAPAVVPGASVIDVLRYELGGDVVVAPCGGHDRLHQEREQWTDGSNAVCLAPGHIVLYSRNVRTMRVLEAEHGFHSVRLTTSQSAEERAALLAEGMARPRTVYSFIGSELSRARGGARCLTMPIHRDPVPDPGASA